MAPAGRLLTPRPAHTCRQFDPHALTYTQEGVTLPIVNTLPAPEKHAGTSSVTVTKLTIR